MARGQHRPARRQPQVRAPAKTGAGQSRQIPRQSPAKPVETTREKWLYRLIAVLAVVGFAVSVYLTYLYFSKSQASFCAPGSGCDLVRDSKYSSIIGIPVSLVGAIGYALIGVVALLPMAAAGKRLALFALALAGFTFAAYLTYREAFTIQAWCPYCIVSAVTITGILAVVLLQKPVVPGWSRGSLAFLGGSAAVVVLIAAAALPTGVGGKEPAPTSYAGKLAQHLTDSGAVMYGTYWCSACRTQKELFGSAEKYLPYVECDARGRDPQPARCTAAGVKAYPTWSIGGKTYEGVQQLLDLARLSGYQE